MKRGNKLWAMLAVLLVLAGMTVIVSKLNPENVDETEETQEATVLSVVGENITGLSWDDGETKLAFTYDGEAWSYTDDSRFPLDVSYLEAAAAAVREITVNRTIEGVEDLSEYGLDEPSHLITVTSDSDLEIRVGIETELGGEYYLSVGDGNVYLVETGFLDDFNYELYDMLKEESIPDMSQTIAVAVQSEVKDVLLMYAESNGLSYSESYTWNLAVDSTNESGEVETEYHLADTELAEAFVNEVINLSWNDCVDYYAEDHELTGYGLDEPTAVVSIIYAKTTQVATNEKDEDGNVIYEEETTEETFGLEIGDYADSGCYARISGSNMIYLIDAALSDTLLYTGYEELRIDDVLRMDMETVTAVDVTIDSTVYTMEKKTVTNTDTEGNATETSVYTLNGNEIDIESTLEGINSMASTGYGYGVTPQRSEEIRILFHRNTENFSQVELVFYQYDSSSCLVTLDGEATQFVARTDVTALIEAIEQAVLDSETVEESAAAE